MNDAASFLILGAATLWLALSIGVSLVIGRVIKHAEKQRPR